MRVQGLPFSTHVTLGKGSIPVRTLGDVDACGADAVRREQGTQTPMCTGITRRLLSGRSKPNRGRDGPRLGAPGTKAGRHRVRDVHGVHLPLTTAPSHHLLSGSDGAQDSFLQPGLHVQ